MNTVPLYKSLIAVSLVIGLALGIAACGDRSPSSASAPEAQSDDLRTAVSDTVLTARVKAELMRLDNIRSSDIEVTTTNGVVTLRGDVDSNATRNAAAAATRSVEGVVSVDNNLVTASSNANVAEASRIASDTWITTKVKSMLLADSVSQGLDISVETTDGVVVLEGELDNREAIDHVKKIAGEVDGVKSVNTDRLITPMASRN